MKTHDLVLGLLGFIVLIAVGSAFFIIGSPLEKQQKALDQTRLRNFRTISTSIDSYYSTHKVLPEGLDVLSLENLDNVTKDPGSRVYYTYKKIDEVKYELCTTFDKDTKKEQQRLPKPYDEYPADREAHGKGYYCIPYTISSYLIPRPTPTFQPSPKNSSSIRQIESISTVSQDSGAKIQWLHSSSGTDTVLLVTATYWIPSYSDKASNITSISYGGKQLTKIRRDQYADRASEMWYIPSPPKGRAVIAVAYNVAPDAQAYGAMTISDVDLKSPISNHSGFGSAVSDPLHATTVINSMTPREGDLVVGVLAAYPDGGTNKIRSDSSSAFLWDVSAFNLNVENIGNAVIAEDTSATFSWSMTKKFPWTASMVAINLKP